jgi:hypothetical protein
MTAAFQNRSLDRRTFLRGTATAIAVPWLDAMAKAVSSPPMSPRRALFVYLPSGVKLDEWTPAAGKTPRLPYLLEPLEPVRSRVTIISGLALDGGRAHGDGPGDHAREAASFLTCAHPRKTGGADVHVGVSVDQVLAKAIGEATRFASLELGTERGVAAGICDSGYSCAYSNNISWRTKQTPVAKETEPRAVFARLFGDPESAMDQSAQQRQRARTGSVLDAVRGDAESLARELGGRDRQKLDEYLDSVRELERRIEQEAKQVVDVPDVSAGLLEGSGDFAHRLDAMYELLSLALATDQTRVASLMLGNAGSNRSYRFLGVPEGHHDLSHHGGDAHKLAGVRAIVRFHIERFAAFLQQLEAREVSGARLLERTMVVFGSGLSDGDRHNHEDLPVLLCGGHRGDRHLQLQQETPMANLYVSVLRASGVKVDEFADSTGALDV